VKSLVLSMIIFPSFVMAACPDLNGEFICSNNLATGVDYAITTEIIGNVYKYKDDQFELNYRIDGKTYSSNLTSSDRLLSYSAYCSDNKLIVNVINDYIEEGKVKLDTVIVNDKGNQNIDTDITILETGQVIEQRIKCIRK